MTNEEIIKKIKDICDRGEVENDCPFYDEEYGRCIFWQQGIPIPLEWGVDDEKDMVQTKANSQGFEVVVEVKTEG